MSIRRLTLTGLVVLGMTLLGVVPAAGAENEPIFELKPAKGGFSHPTGVAVNQETGNVYVADGVPAEAIDVFGPEGGVPAGGGPSEITGFSFAEEPAGVAVDNACHSHEPRLNGEECNEFDPSNGDIYVADTRANAIEKFSFNAGSESYEEEKLAEIPEPNGVAVDPQGNVYVADYSEGIVEFDSTGKEVGRIEQHTVENPAYIAVDGLGDVYVGSYHGGVAKLQVNSKHEVLSEVLLDEVGRAVAVDAHGNVFVDRETSIVEYDSSGSLVEEFGSEAFGGSQGIAVGDGAEGEEIYVSNPNGANVVVFGQLPPVITGAPSSVQAMTATLAGTVNPEGSPVEACMFNYGATPLYGLTAECSPNPGSGESPVAVSAALTDLVPNETYHYRLVATKAEGARRGRDREFTTPSVVAVIDQSPSVSGTTRTSATLAGGAINPEHTPTYYYLEYGTSESYGRRTPASLAGSQLGEVALAGEEIRELQAGTLYHYRLLAVNAAGTARGSDQTFTTAPRTPPIVATSGASDIVQTSATISGTVDTRGLATAYGFEIGISPASLGPPIGMGGVGTGVNEASVTLVLHGLRAGTTYFYRITATSLDGASYGEALEFTTPGLSNLLSPPAAAPLIAAPAIRFPPEAKNTSKPSHRSKHKAGKTKRRHRGKRHPKTKKRKK